MVASRDDATGEHDGSHDEDDARPDSAERVEERAVKPDRCKGSGRSRGIKDECIRENETNTGGPNPILVLVRQGVQGRDARR